MCLGLGWSWLTSKVWTGGKNLNRCLLEDKTKSEDKGYQLSLKFDSKYYAQPLLPGQVDQRTCQEELFPRQSANQPAAGCKRQLQIVRIICTCNRTHYVHYIICSGSGRNMSHIQFLGWGFKHTVPFLSLSLLGYYSICISGSAQCVCVGALVHLHGDGDG